MINEDWYGFNTILNIEKSKATVYEELRRDLPDMKSSDYFIE